MLDIGLVVIFKNILWKKLVCFFFFFSFIKVVLKLLWNSSLINALRYLLIGPYKNNLSVNFMCNHVMLQSIILDIGKFIV